VFIVIFVGIVLACLTLAFEYWYYKYRNPQAAGQQNNRAGDKVFTVRDNDPIKQDNNARYDVHRRANFSTDFQLVPPRHQLTKPNY
jgi:hypothetical protein